jgi:hypothetical protein
MSDSYYTGGVPTIRVDDAEEIAELCILAGRPDRIGEFLGSRHAGRGEEPADRSTGSDEHDSASSGEPVDLRRAHAGETDVLAAVLKKRFEAMYPKSGG